MATALLLFGNAGHGQISNQSFLLGIALDKTITIQANNASLKEVLLEMEAQTGIPVVFIADTTQRISVNIEQQTIEAAIEKLTSNYMIVRDLQDGKEAISEIIIISDDPGSASAGDDSTFLPSGQPAPAIIDADNAQPNTAPSSDPLQNQPTPESQNAQPAPAPAPNN